MDLTPSVNQLSAWIDETQKTIQENDFESIINEYKESYIGKLSYLPISQDILRARRFFSSSAYFGYRLGKNMLTLCPTNLTKNYDLYFTDCNGVVKTDVHESISALDRAIQAKSKKIPVIAFFGGSTMMGDGSRLPKFTIPSQVEKLLLLQYGYQTCCINFGIAGTSSIDALNILDSDVIHQYQPDVVIFYDGWNCCTQYIFKTLVSENPELNSKIKIYDRQSLFSIVHDNYIKKSFEFTWLFKYLMVIATIKALSSVMIFSKNKTIKKSITHWLQRLPIYYGKQTMYADIYNNLPKEDVIKESLAARAAHSYIRIHETARKHCAIEGVQFLTFLQPLQDLGKKALTDTEINNCELTHSSLISSNMFRSFYNEIKRQLLAKPEYTDLTDCFDNATQEIYIDDGHINAYGNYLVADRISEVIVSSKKITG
jgi:lysophospholipase L1-like esterase